MRIAVFSSGGGTKLPFILSSVLYLLQKIGIYIVAYGGSSAGAIASFSAALGKQKEMVYYSLNLNEKHFSSFNINSWIGRIRTYSNLMFKGYMFDLGNLDNTIRKIVSKTEFTEWKSHELTPDCFVCVVDPEEPEVKLINLKDVDYDEAINLVVASSSVMPINPAIKTEKGYRIDGGHWHHNPASLYAKLHENEFDKIITIYSRPKLNVIDESPKDGDPMNYNYSVKKGFANLMRAIDIQTIRASIADEKELDSMTDSSRVLKIFAPKKLTGSTHEIKEGQNKTLTELGVKEAAKAVIKIIKKPIM